MNHSLSLVWFGKLERREASIRVPFECLAGKPTYYGITRASKSPQTYSYGEDRFFGGGVDEREAFLKEQLVAGIPKFVEAKSESV